MVKSLICNRGTKDDIVHCGTSNESISNLTDFNDFTSNNIWGEEIPFNLGKLILLFSPRSLIVGLSRLPLVNSYVATPPDVWRQGWAPELSGPCRTFVPPLPVDYLQDIDVLQQLVFR
jgi:hypothetical protein